MEEKLIVLNTIPPECGRVTDPLPAIAKEENQRTQAHRICFVSIDVAAVQDPCNLLSLVNGAVGASLIFGGVR